jgi:transposase-like protein
MSNAKSVGSKSNVSKKKNYAPQFKFERAIDALRGVNNIAEVGRKYAINPNLLYLWRDQLVERGAAVFATAPDKEVNELKAKVGRLEQMIGKKEVELNLLKNFSDFYSSQNTT